MATRNCAAELRSATAQAEHAAEVGAASSQEIGDARRRGHHAFQHPHEWVGETKVFNGFEADRLFRGGSTTRLLPYLAMGSNASDGNLNLHNGWVNLDWNHRTSRALFKEIEQGLRQLSTAAGGNYETSLLWRWPLRKLLTAHPLGGCAVGKDKATSVVRHQGEVWDIPASSSRTAQLFQPRWR